VVVDAHAGIGYVELPEASRSGVDVDLEGTVHGEIGGEVRLELDVGIGELLVLVPSGSDVLVDAHAGIGNVELPETSRSGVDVDLEGTVHGEIGGEVRLELDVGIGSIRVEQR